MSAKCTAARTEQIPARPTRGEVAGAYGSARGRNRSHPTVLALAYIHLAPVRVHLGGLGEAGSSCRVVDGDRLLAFDMRRAHQSSPLDQ